MLHTLLTTRLVYSAAKNTEFLFLVGTISKVLLVYLIFFLLKYICPITLYEFKVYSLFDTFIYCDIVGIIANT